MRVCSILSENNSAMGTNWSLDVYSTVKEGQCYYNYNLQPQENTRDDFIAQTYRQGPSISYTFPVPTTQLHYLLALYISEHSYDVRPPSPFEPTRC